MQNTPQIPSTLLPFCWQKCCIFSSHRDIADMPGSTTIWTRSKTNSKRWRAEETGITSVFSNFIMNRCTYYSTSNIFRNGKNLLRIESKPTGKRIFQNMDFCGFWRRTSDDWKTRFQKETVRGKIRTIWKKWFQYSRNMIETLWGLRTSAFLMSGRISSKKPRYYRQFKISCSISGRFSFG